MSVSAEGPSRGTVVIATERCKGCELCIPACPPKLLSGCTGCGACLLVCPDFCFEVYQFEAPQVGEGDS
jgi:2-oxoglutarate ferredoxin oxidoreductase subunit delta